jgi:hypothetical protein
MVRPTSFDSIPMIVDENGEERKMNRREFQLQEDERIKWSWRAVELITNPSEAFAELLEERATFVVQELLKVLDDESCGSIFHFKKAFLFMLNHYREQTVQGLAAARGLTKMVAFLDEPAIAECVLQIFSNNGSDTCVKCMLLEMVREGSFLMDIVCRIVSDNHRWSDTAMEFFIQFMDLCLRDDIMCMVFRELAVQTEVFPLLVGTAIGKHISAATFNAVQQKNAAECALQILRRGAAAWEIFEDGMEGGNHNITTNVRVQAEVYSVWSSWVLAWVQPLCAYLGRLDKVCKEINSVRLSAYEVEKPFTSVRLALIEMLNEFVHCQGETLDLIPESTWASLCNWFFRYRFNNLYLVRFANLFEMALLENHVRSIKVVLSQNKFLSQMIKHFQEIGKTDARGCILELCNLMRLKAESLPPRSYLRSFLVSHGPWRN